MSTPFVMKNNYNKLLIAIICLLFTQVAYSQYYSNEAKDKLIRTLFSEYSPKSKYIIDNIGDFNYLYYLKGKNTEAEILTSLEILVHESTHALSSTDLFSKTQDLKSGNEIVSLHKIKPINNLFTKAVRTSSFGIYTGDFDIENHVTSFDCIYITDSISILMRKPKQFCENSINEFVPEVIRKEIYRIAYTQNCNGRGVFSYINEFSAYYNGCKSIIDLNEYILEKTTSLNNPDYLIGLMRALSTLDSYYEMKLFIAWSLIYAKNNDVDAYIQLYNNVNLRTTYTLIDQLFTKLIVDSMPLIKRVEDLYTYDFKDDIKISGYQFYLPALGSLKYIFDLPNTKTSFLKNLFTKEVTDELKKFELSECSIDNYQSFLKDPRKENISSMTDSIINPIASNTVLYDSVIIEDKPIIYREIPTLSDFTKTSQQKRYFEILEKYSPECYSMLTDYYTLPRKIVCPEIEWTLEAPINIESLIDKKDFYGSIPWAVFNLCHKYTTIKGNVIAASERKCEGMKEGLYAYSINPQKVIIVNHTNVITTKKIAKKIPEALRGQYFQSTMASKDKNLATQKYGIYGLLDEYNSFYYAMRVTLDLLDAYKSEFKTNTKEWLQFFGRSEMIYSIYSEYKLYMLEYLKATKYENPDIYAGIISNEEFKQAFFEIDKNWVTATREYDQFKKEVFQFLSKNNQVVKETKNSIQIGNMAIATQRDYFSKVELHLNTFSYHDIYNDLEYDKNSKLY